MKIRKNIDRYFDKLDEKWRAMPVNRQRRYTLYLFLGYLILTVGIIVKIWYDTRQSKNDMHIDHIEKPALRNNEKPASWQDTLSNFKRSDI